MWDMFDILSKKEEIQYSPGTSVQILIPTGNFNQIKF